MRQESQIPSKDLIAAPYTAMSGIKALVNGKARLITIEEIKARATQELKMAFRAYKIEQLLRVSLIGKYPSSQVTRG